MIVVSVWFVVSMVYGLRRGLGALAQLMTNIIQQRRFSDGGKRLCAVLKPTSEVKKIISVGANGARGQLTSMLRIEEFVGPSDRMVLVIEQAIGAGAGLNSR